MSLQIGEPGNKSKLLELGKEITENEIYRWQDTYSQYVHFEDIKEETLISIAKSVYQNRTAFLDYLRESYEEKGFYWTEGVESYDIISGIVWEEIIKSGQYFYSYESELILLITPLREILEEDNLKDKISDIKYFKPLTVMLNEETKEYISIRLSDDKKGYIVDTNSQSTHLVSNINGNRYAIDTELKNLIEDIKQIANCYV